MKKMPKLRAKINKSIAHISPRPEMPDIADIFIYVSMC